MKQTRNLLYLLITLLLPRLPLSAQSIVQKLDSLFTALEQAHTFNGNVLVAQNGSIIYSRSMGFANFEQQKANSSASCFQVGSVSKTFTAVAVLQLQEKGKLKTEDRFSRYFPAFPYPDVTIYQLLTHTSGIPDKEELFFPIIENQPNRLFSNQDIIPAMQALKKPLAFTPGTQWRYCNMGYALLALLVEKVSKQAFHDYLQQHIFLPANMQHTYLLHSQAAAPNRVSGYLVRAHYLGDLESIDSSKKVRPWSYNMRGFEGPTNIVSTTGDLLKYDAALRNNTLLKATTMAKMFTPSQLRNGSAIQADGEFGKASYGMGWFLPTDTSAGKIVMHTGREPGFFSFFLRDITHQRTIILLDNTESSGFGKACRESFNILSSSSYFPEPQYKQSLFLPYVKILYTKGADEAIIFFNRFKFDTAHYFTDERELNELGLELLNDHHNKAALEALKLCTILYPDSWNTYDSYGKALLQDGKKEAAILMYQKSVEMNPHNEPAKKILARIQQE